MVVLRIPARSPEMASKLPAPRLVSPVKTGVW